MIRLTDKMGIFERWI